MKQLMLLLAMCATMTTLHAQGAGELKLNRPDLNRGVNVMKAFSDRHSDREFSTRELSLQDLSDLLWAANGVNRLGDGKRTAPSALNKQDVDIYVFLAKGVYLYDASKHVLKLVAEGDHRAVVAGRQDFVKQAPVSLVYVSDLSRFGMGLDEQVKLMGAMDAGIVSQNVNLFCAGVGLSTVPRASMDQEALRKLLKLSDTQVPMMNNPVGYSK